MNEMNEYRSDFFVRSKTTILFREPEQQSTNNEQWQSISQVSKCRPGTTNLLPPHDAFDAKTGTDTQPCHPWATCELRDRDVASGYTFTRFEFRQLSRLSRKEHPELETSHGETTRDDHMWVGMRNGDLCFTCWISFCFTADIYNTSERGCTSPQRAQGVLYCPYLYLSLGVARSSAHNSSVLVIHLNLTINPWPIVTTF